MVKYLSFHKSSFALIYFFFNVNSVTRPLVTYYQFTPDNKENKSKLPNPAISLPITFFSAH